MKAHLSLLSRSFDSTDTSSVVALLEALRGVESAQASLLQNRAEVVYDSEAVPDPQAFVATLLLGGFDGSVRSAGPACSAKLATLGVEGMSCTACSSSAEAALLRVPGVRSASVSVVLKEARVEYDPVLASEADLVAAVEGAGFDAKVKRQQAASSVALRVTGMSCTACSAGVEAVLTAQQGVLQASVDFLSGRAEVLFNPALVGPRALIRALDEAGYPTEPLLEGHDDGSAVRQREMRYWRRKFFVSLAFAVPLMVLSMGLMYVPAAMRLLGRRLWGFKLMDIASLLLATPVQFWVGRGFHEGAWRALRLGRANMDVLVSVGTNAAYFASAGFMVYEALVPEYGGAGSFFETSAFLITFICLGKYLESIAKGKTSQAISELMALAPTTAILCTTDAAGKVVQEEEVAVQLVQQGDLLKILPGARVPADGSVVAGASHVDESMVTGEPLPVTKRQGDEVIGGTVNGGGVLLMRAARVGADTALSQIVRLVETAQMSKAPIQAYADRLSAIFVPTVLALAVLVFSGWYAAGLAGLYPPSWLPPATGPLLFSLTFGISVVVIACPCALGLALPTALMVGTGVGARNGVLIKSAEALERAQALQALVFDKTGTLTRGRPAVVAAHHVDTQVPLTDILLLAASAESGSEHPLAAAVVAHAAGVLRLESGAPQQAQQQQQQLAMVEHRATNGVNGTYNPRSNGKAAAGDDSVLTHPLLDGSYEASCAPRASKASMPPALQTAAQPAAGGLSGDFRGVGPQQEQQEEQPGEERADGQQQPQQEEEGAAGQAQGSIDVAVTLGNRRLMAQRGIPISAEAEQWMARGEQLGRTNVLVAVQGRLAAVLAIADPIKPEAPAVVAALQRAGLRTAMLTGDNWASARAVANQLGIERVIAEVLPAGKAEQIRRMQASGLEQEGLVVGMVGDGVNDSPALAAADVSIAIGSGTAIAVETADYVLVRSNLGDILTALDLSRATFRCIRRNYAWALGYNLLMIPLAAGALYPTPLHLQLPPWLAGAAMAFSSLSVVASSLLLRGYRPPRPAAEDCQAGKGALRGVIVE
ncbi:hypothetical protein N2152v2_009496 [Parachlorella kessleri]